jgi:hypothetical protein
MGLDMYAEKVAVEKIGDSVVDFDSEGSSEIFYWRKHPNLHGWMEALYRKKGGKDESFNVSRVRLTSEDIDQLERDVTGEKLPETTGFFFGWSGPEDQEKDIAFIKIARATLAEGYAVFYTSWW